MKNDNLIEHADQSALLNTHAATPWKVGRGDRIEQASTGRIIADMTHSEFSPGNAPRIVACVNACTGIQEPEKAIQGAREALERAVNAAQYAVRLIEANDKAGQSASPFEKADWIGTVAHIYGAMAFVTEARAALKQLGGKL